MIVNRDDHEESGLKGTLGSPASFFQVLCSNLLQLEQQLHMVILAGSMSTSQKWVNLSLPVWEPGGSMGNLGPCFQVQWSLSVLLVFMKNNAKQEHFQACKTLCRTNKQSFQKKRTTHHRPKLEQCVKSRVVKYLLGDWATFILHEEAVQCPRFRSPHPTKDPSPHTIQNHFCLLLMWTTLARCATSLPQHDP